MIKKSKKYTSWDYAFETFLHSYIALLHEKPNFKSN